MRKAIFAILFIALFLVACSRESVIREQQSVRLFTAMNENVQYSEKSFSGSDAKAVADLVKTECPQGVGDKFVRATLEAKAASLVIYTTPDGKNITCTVLKPKDQKSIQLKTAQEAPNKDAAILVNGQQINYTQIQQALAAIPREQRDINTTNTVIMQLVDAELLRQQAENITVTEKEFADAREAALRQANVTEEQLASVLKQNGVSQEAFDQSIRQQAQLEKLLKDRLLIDELNVSEEEARAYYLQNTNQFVQGEQATARFLMISSQNRTLEQGRARAQEVVAKLNSTDFCSLVQQYSDDAASRQNCGTYLVPRGVLNPNLEVAAFSTPANQTVTVQTDQGIYFVQTVKVAPMEVYAYPQVAANLQSSMRNALLQQRLNLYLAMLRSDATIVSYLG